MPYYAEIDPDTNIVQRVIRVDTEEWCVENLGGVWKRTYYDTPPNVYAGIGYEYVPEHDNFRSPRPYPSWTFDAVRWMWVPPIPMPEVSVGQWCDWDEETQTWLIR